MLKKLKKNPTFNEYFPQKLTTGDPPELLFDYVFYFNEPLKNAVLSLFSNDSVYVKQAFEVNFRNLNGSREVDNTVLQDVFADLYDTTYEQLGAILVKYHYKWLKLVNNVYAQTYNPLENYDRQEDTSLTYEGSENVIRNVDSDRKIKGTTADTRNDTSSAESSSQKNVFAFDSSTASPSDSDSGTTTATGTGSSNSTVDNSDVEKRTETEGHSFNDRKNVTASRIHGNIGVTTSQQMLESEVALRMKHDFFDTVYEDIANTLLKPIY